LKAVHNLSSALRANGSVTCIAGYFYQQPVGIGRYFSGVAANDNHPLLAKSHGIYVALAALAVVCGLLISCI
jgi:hypothetical protein